MPRKAYRDRLVRLRTDVVLLAELVVERYKDALVAMESGDTQRADQIIRGDDEINSRYLELEGECINLVAHHQPVAGDLRLITASFKILTDLERIADLAVNLAVGTEYGPSDIYDTVDTRDLGMTAADMVASAVEAYERDATDACRAVAAAEDSLDADCEAANRRIIRELIAERTDDDHDDQALAAMVNQTTHALLTVRDIERVGDHAVNIAARTLYMLESDDELLY